MNGWRTATAALVIASGLAAGCSSPKAGRGVPPDPQEIVVSSQSSDVRGTVLSHVALLSFGDGGHTVLLDISFAQLIDGEPMIPVRLRRWLAVEDLPFEWKLTAFEEPVTVAVWMEKGEIRTWLSGEDEARMVRWR